MDHPLVRPNLHVILIHYPLAMLVAGTFIELFSFFWPRGTFRAAGRWMILLGALLAVPATFSGIYAMRDVASRNNPTTDGAWVTVKATSPLLSQPQVWQTLQRHMLFQSVATALCVLVVVSWLGASDTLRQTLRVPLLAVLLVGTGGIICGAWFGGEAVYRHAVAVELPTDLKPSGPPPTYAFENYISVAELHVIGAGTMVAVALGAIGMSFRKISATLIQPGDTRPIIPRDELRGPRGPMTPPDPIDLLRSFNPSIEVTNNPFAPAGRFWIFAFLIGLCVAAGGLFLTFGDANLLDTARTHHQPIWQVAWNQIKPTDGQKINRLVAHLGAGLTLIVTPLVLALLSRFAPRRRFVLSFFTLVLLVAVTAQVWIGILLLFDTPDGPVTRFQTAASVK